jgi:competence protein ComEC
MRNEVEGRPLLGIVGALIIGLTSALHPLNLLFFPLALYVWRRMEFRVALSATLLLGCLMAPLPAPSLPKKRQFTGLARVGSVPNVSENKTTFNARLGGMEGWVAVPKQSRISYGDQLLLSAEMVPLGPEDGYLALQGISARVYVRSFETVKPAPIPLRMANQWRWSFIDFAYRTLPHKLAAVASALCFSTQELVDDQFYSDLKSTGTVHIISVSGLHVVVLAVSLLFLLSKIPIPRLAQLGIAAAALSFYALAAGLSPPTVRAVLMLATGFAAYLVRREPDWLSSLCCAAIIYLVLQPRGIYDIGFQLSFVTVAAFFLYLRPQRDNRESVVEEGFSRVRQVAYASFVASLASAPIAIYYFGYTSAVSVLANLVIAPAVEAIVVVAFVAHALSLFAPAIAGFAMAWLVQGWIAFLYATLGFFSAPSWSVIPFPEFNAYALLPFYAGALMAWRPYVRRA